MKCEKKSEDFGIMPRNTIVHNNREKRRLVRYTCPFDIKLVDAKITHEHFEATAIPFLIIERDEVYIKRFFKEPMLTFSTQFNFMKLVGNAICVPYSNWSFWYDPELVKKVEELTAIKKYTEAMAMTLGQDAE